jgi:hypothetical protein
MTATAPSGLFDSAAAPASDLSAVLPAPPPLLGWPTPPDKAAFSGLAGEIVTTLAPHTEADPVAILVILPVGFGSLIGRAALYNVGSTAHRANEFAELIGPSGAGRKGSSWDTVEAILAGADPIWAELRVVSGLSSGEALIWHLRDRDDGIAVDQRLLVLEPEYAQVLKAIARDTNTLSPVVRNAWDHRVLQVITKHDPARASDGHVAIVAHVTADELVRHVSATEVANGFLNRFLLIAVRRSRLVPEGGYPESSTITLLIDALKDAADHAKWTGQLRMDDKARTLWWRHYHA